MNDDELEYTIDSSGTERWHLNGLLHRTNGPACKRRGGGNSWWKNGLLHRMNGPAQNYGDQERWWINGIVVHSTQLELSIGQSMPHPWYGDESIVLVLKQINHTLFQVILGNKKEYIFSTYNEQEDKHNE